MKHTSLKEEHLELAYHRNWFKLFVSKQFGGGEATLPVGLQAYFDASTIDGSLGWCVNLGSGASIFCGYLGLNAAQEIFTDPKTVIAGSGGIGDFINTEDGLILSGRWDKCTGADHATHYTVNAINNKDEQHSFVVDRNKVTVHPEYYLDGLTRSSSLSISIDGATVPEAYRFNIDVLNSETSYLIHHLDFETFARFCMISSILGMAQCLVNTSKGDLTLYPERTGTIADEFDQFISLSFQEVLELAKEAWRELEVSGNVTTDVKTRLQQIIPHTNKGIFDRANELFYAGGLRFEDSRSEVHRAYKDLVLACQHYLLK